MPLPLLSATGDLPIGVHRATLREVLGRFGVSSGRRKALGLRLARVYGIVLATGQVARCVIFGSFVTSKTDPNDVDIFLVMTDTFDASQLTGEARLVFDHGAAEAHFGTSVFWLRRLAAWPDEQAAVEFWQLERDGSRRGIIELVPAEAS